MFCYPKFTNISFEIPAQIHAGCQSWELQLYVSKNRSCVNFISKYFKGGCNHGEPWSLWLSWRWKRLRWARQFAETSRVVKIQSRSLQLFQFKLESRFDSESTEDDDKQFQKLPAHLRLARVWFWKPKPLLVGLCVSCVTHHRKFAFASIHRPSETMSGAPQQQEVPSGTDNTSSSHRKSAPKTGSHYALERNWIFVACSRALVSCRRCELF